MTGDEWSELRSSDWYEHVSLAEATEQHAKNTEGVRAAVSDYQRKDRPLRILAIHGSGRTATTSAVEESNSKVLLRTGLEAVPDGMEVDEVELRTMAIEPCNGCYSTTSALCHFPCTCFPFDDMQQLYQKVLRSDVLLFSTGVNQSMVSTRLKAFIDRLISLDGGLFLAPEQYAPKDEHFKRSCMALAASGDFAYSPRLVGRVCAYFITSKDQNNQMGPARQFDYRTLVTESLWSCFHDYGCVHADPWFCFAAAKHPQRDLQYDKADFNEQPKIHSRAKAVVNAAIRRAKQVRKDGYTPPVDRVNRT